MLNKFFRELFDEDSVWTGWSVYWRMQLLSFAVTLILGLIALNNMMAFFAGIVSALSTMVILGYVMRRVALKMPSAPLSLATFYIGWSAFWRYALLGLPGLLVISSLSLLAAASLSNEWIVLIGLPFIVLWLSASMGWAASRVRRLVRPPGTDSENMTVN